MQSLAGKMPAFPGGVTWKSTQSLAGKMPAFPGGVTWKCTQSLAGRMPAFPGGVTWKCTQSLAGRMPAFPGGVPGSLRNPLRARRISLLRMKRANGTAFLWRTGWVGTEGTCGPGGWIRRYGRQLLRNADLVKLLANLFELPFDRLKGKQRKRPRHPPNDTHGLAPRGKNGQGRVTAALTRQPGRDRSRYWFGLMPRVLLNHSTSVSSSSSVSTAPCSLIVTRTTRHPSSEYRASLIRSML